MTDDHILDKFTDEELERFIARSRIIFAEYDCNFYKIKNALMELKRYRELAGMRRDMLESELGHVFGGYSEDELREKGGIE